MTFFQLCAVPRRNSDTSFAWKIEGFQHGMAQKKESEYCPKATFQSYVEVLSFNGYDFQISPFETRPFEGAQGMDEFAVVQAMS